LPTRLGQWTVNGRRPSALGQAARTATPSRGRGTRVIVGVAMAPGVLFRNVAVLFSLYPLFLPERVVPTALLRMCRTSGGKKTHPLALLFVQFQCTIAVRVTGCPDGGAGKQTGTARGKWLRAVPAVLRGKTKWPRAALSIVMGCHKSRSDRMKRAATVRIAASDCLEQRSEFQEADHGRTLQRRNLSAY
jgi:hypothetical protein